MPLEFSVFGVPQPQGSSKAFMPKGARYPTVTSDNVNLKGWRHLVASAAQQHAPSTGLIAEPVRVTLWFELVRPRSLPKKRAHHTTKPDVDKLARGILDALTGILLRDDSQVVELLAQKRYAGAGLPPGVRVRIEQIA
jgi:crossover junction endodeoxyribonuclease RusA